jgi:hypothetical protein
MARLIYVPVVHSTAEMGSAGPAYKAAFVAQYGAAGWDARTAQFDAIWLAIANAIDALWLDLKRIKLFQDSLPVCDREFALVQELAALGSQNHRLLVRLVGGGATLVGTESPELLVQEYRMVQSPEARTTENAAALLESRDRFIAGRIAGALGDEDDGLLFIGALHDVAKFLPPRIRVEYLVFRGQ